MGYYWNISSLVTHDKESDALSLLRIVWKAILKWPKEQIDDILRGPADLIKSGRSGRVVQTILQQLIFYHLDKLDREAHKITEGAKHVLQLKDFLSKRVVNLHAETQSLVNQYNIPNEDQSRETQQFISEYVVNILDETQRLFEWDAREEDQAEKLHNLISDHIAQMRSKTNIKKTYSSRVMFIAAEVGNTNFLLELIRESPDLIWKVNDNGLRTIQMKFTSGKTVTLHNVLHVPTISKSLVYVGKLDEHGFKIAIKSRKVVITKRGLFMGKGYYQEGMYRLNVKNESPKNVSDSNITTVSNQISHVSLRSNFACS
ncbi:hypothetical protein Tco_0949752 [Tanacetum coccineum]